MTGTTLGPIDRNATDPKTGATAQRCLYVRNDLANPIFVPFNSAAEWTAFITAAPSIGVILTPCARPATMTIQAGDPACGPAVVSGSSIVSLPYAPAGTLLNNDGTVTFQCMTAGQGWTETATASFTAGDAGYSDAPAANGGWSMSVVYGGSPPAAVANNDTPPAPAPSTCTANPSVCQLYETYLGREPETAGAVYWDGIIATMQQQGATTAQIQQTLTAGIAGSVEAGAKAGVVDQQTFQQASQQAVANAQAFGAANNISNPLATCVTGSSNCSSIQMNQLTQSSQQAISQAGASLSNSALTQVTADYQSILGRNPDVGGLAYWTSQINSGAMTVQQVQQAIASSPEAQAKNGK